MKNDIIGSFAIIVVAFAFLLFAKNYDDGAFWMLSPNLMSPATQEEETTAMAETVIDVEPTPTSMPEGEAEKPNKNTPPLPYVQSVVTDKISKEISDLQYLENGTFYWPVSASKKSGTKYEQIIGAQGLTMEVAYDNTGKTHNAQRKIISNALKKIGFKQKTFKWLTCQTAEMEVFSDCLDYYIRGDLKCAVYLVGEPIDRNDEVKKTSRIVQLRVWCGEIVNNENNLSQD